MQLGRTRFVTGYSSRLVIDEKRGTVWRYGFGQTAGKVIRNYHWLQRAHRLIPTPVPRTIRQLGPLVVTAETLVPGQPLPPTAITLAIIPTLLAALAPLYQRTKYIHGDLTHRNILSAPGGFYFIDGDRSVVAPPEFDIWLLVADAAVHSTRQASHRHFLQHLKASKPTDTPYRQATVELYRHVPAAAINESSWPQLWDTFFKRCKEHCIADCLRRKKSLDFLDGLE